MQVPGRPGDVLGADVDQRHEPDIVAAAERGREIGMQVWALTTCFLSKAPNSIFQEIGDNIVKVGKTRLVRAASLDSTRMILGSGRERIRVGGGTLLEERTGTFLEVSAGDEIDPQGPLDTQSVGEVCV